MRDVQRLRDGVFVDADRSTGGPPTTAFRGRFRSARAGLQTVLCTDDWLSLPASVVEFQGTFARPFSDYYRLSVHGPRGPLGEDIRGIAERLCLDGIEETVILDLARACEDLVSRGLTADDVRGWEQQQRDREDAIFAAEHPEDYARIRGFVEHLKRESAVVGALSPVVEGLLIVRGLACQAVSLIDYGVPIGSLWLQARAGDDAALFQVARIDKSVLTEAWACQRLTTGQLRGDREFFVKLGAAVAARPLRDLKTVPREAVLMVARFWDEFRGHTYESMLTFLRAERVVRASMGPEDLRKALVRAGLRRRQGRVTGRRS